MRQSAYYRNDWQLDLDQGTTDVSKYFVDIDAFERKVDDPLIMGREILFQTLKVTFIYHDEFKDIIDNADANDVHVIFINVSLPESGSERTVMQGAVDLRSIAIDETERLVSFDLLDKLAYASMFAFPEYREKNVDIYDAFGLDYSNGDRLKMCHDVPGVMFFGVDSNGNYIDLNSCSLNGGEIIEYEDNGYTKRLFVLSIEESTVEDDNHDTYKSYYSVTYGVKGKNEDYPAAVCHDESNGVEFSEGFLAYSHLVYGKDIYIRDDNDAITDIDGAKLIEAILLEIETEASVVNNMQSEKAVGVKDWYSLTFISPDDMKEQLKKLAKKIGVSLFVDNSFNYVIQEKFYYLTGTERTYEDWHAKKNEIKRSAFDIEKRYKTKVDGNDGVVLSKIYDNPWYNFGVTKKLDFNYNGVTQDEETLENFASLMTGLRFQFYGKMHGGYELELALLKDSYFDWELYDNIGGIESGYFIISIKYDFINSKMTVELVEINGHTPTTQ